MIETRLVCAFPGTGKTFYSTSYIEKMPDNWCIDSDSSMFSKDKFPQNYIEHIKSNIGKYKIIFISSHENVRKELVKEGLFFTLVYPEIGLKNEYIKRYKESGNNELFVNLLENNWFDWITQLIHQDHCNHVILGSKQFISNVM